MLSLSDFDSSFFSAFFQSRGSSSSTSKAWRYSSLVLPAEHEGLVDDAHLGAERHGLEQLLDVFRIQADAAVARAQADASRLVRAVDQVARPAEVERVAAERIVGAGTDHALAAPRRSRGAP